MIPPKPPAREDRVSLWTYWKLFRKDILSAQPERLYRAKMAEFKTPFFRSFLINAPELVRLVLQERPGDFPKSERVTRGLRPLLGASVFTTNGRLWEQQRRIIDPAFERGQVKSAFGNMKAAADAAISRIEVDQVVDIDEVASFATADVIFRTLFSVPIDDGLAKETYSAFREFQRAQPVAVASALIPRLPVWHSGKARAAARELRGALRQLVDRRVAEIVAGTAPDDFGTRLMTTPDPETGEKFSSEEMVDQVAIFFLAGHETSASLLTWALWCLAESPDWEERVVREAIGFQNGPSFSALSKMPATRNVLRETLRLYPPVPMFVREASKDEVFRKREVRKGAQIVVSPWHIQRHQGHWDAPDAFDPGRWETDAGKASARIAFLPFSNGPRVCPGASFAMAEGAVLLATLMSKFRFEAVDRPVPVAHLTVRAENPIRLRVSARH